MTELAHTGEVGPLGFHTGDRLRKAREASGFDKKHFAAELGVARDTVTAYEHWVDMQRPRESMLRQWSLACGVSLHWLKTGIGNPVPVGPLAQLAESRTFNPKSALDRHLHLVHSERGDLPHMHVVKSS